MCCWLVALSVGHGGEKIALVIGNSKYGGAAELTNPKNDATSMNRELAALGFKVSLVLDADRQRMNREIGKFIQSLNKDAIALFYFAGHGFQVQGANYLLPLKAEADDLYVAKNNSVSLNQIFDAFRVANSSVNVVILDCCRNNPFTNERVARSAGSFSRGLADVPPPPGTIIAFSTTSGETAADGHESTNSPFTEALAGQLSLRPESGLLLSSVLRNTSKEVFKKTRQDPILNIPGSADEVYLFGKANKAEGIGNQNQLALAQAEMLKQIAEMKAALEKQKLDMVNQTPNVPTPHTTTPPPAPAQNDVQTEAMKEMLALIQAQKEALKEEREALSRERERMKDAPPTIVMTTPQPSAPTRTFVPEPEPELPYGSYTTVIGNRDHYNSSGTRHWEAVEIMKQDRANYHRFGKRDSGDQSDPYLTTSQKRASAYFSMSSSTASAVKSGNPTVRVIRKGSGSYSVSVISH